MEKNIAETNETACHPICRGGCGNGYCSSPNLCACDIGFEGHHCTQSTKNYDYYIPVKNLIAF